MKYIALLISGLIILSACSSNTTTSSPVKNLKHDTNFIIENDLKFSKNQAAQIEIFYKQLFASGEILDIVFKQSPDNKFAFIANSLSALPSSTTSCSIPEAVKYLYAGKFVAICCNDKSKPAISFSSSKFKAGVFYLNKSADSEALLYFTPVKMKETWIIPSKCKISVLLDRKTLQKLDPKIVSLLYEGTLQYYASQILIDSTPGARQLIEQESAEHNKIN